MTSYFRTRQTEYLSQFSILNELIENGFADYTSNSCEVEVSEILNLSEIDKQILNLPTNYPYDIYIQSDGQLNQNTFKFKYGFYDFIPNGSKLQVKRNGPVLEIDDNYYLLSPSQYCVCEEIDNFNLLGEGARTYQHNLKCFADIKSFSSKAASYLDDYLQSQNYYHPDKIKIDVEFENNSLEIIPTIDIDNSIGFTNVFDQFQNIRDVTSVR